ncbi:RBBP9/YdeN family alpha/beta hydrolase [Notoacmeibacter ruber]|uniref:Serine hydrolase family protein n=1 Tax=Notoacmeibacter ruber TaxID=2670375 RepID=A0A3L7JBF4_9HYPH|nr:alpha/beta hydrolase [Notoacmeibacter ruber]RLQ88067.1 serine hydrolase family protein [Notoacmeibacter ruber]
MKAKNATILFLPDYDGASDDHWLTRWQTKLSTGRKLHLERETDPTSADGKAALAVEIDATEKPVVLVGHGLGASLAVLAAHDHPDRVRGAFLVAPRDLEGSAFGPYPREPLPFPSLVVASRNDPHCAFAVAEDLAGAWGSLFIDGGDIGRINEESGHGPWPEGSLTFARFVSRLPD